jgi:predicted DNA-binding ribbon-helix-helix protein
VAARLRKRSIHLSGHATSLALEAAFWSALSAMAAERRLSLTGLIADIDAGRGEQPLASACRTAALAWALAGRA